MTITKKSRFIRLISALLLAVSIFTSMGTGALAANKSCSVIYGNASSSTTFTVQTGSRLIFKSKVTITQNKGTAQYRNWYRNLKTHKIYAAYTVTYSKLDSNGKVISTKNKSFTGSSCTLKLDCNSKYRIKITPYRDSYYTTNHATWGTFQKWTSRPWWSIKSTKGVNLCK